MFNRRRVTTLAAIAVTLGGAALAATAQSEADAAVSPSAHTTGWTTLHLHVADCDSCSVQLQETLSLRHTLIFQSHRQKVGGDRVVTFKIASAFTHGMSFVVRAPWAKGTHAVPNAVTRYPGQPLGSAVSVEEARGAHLAAGCWAGTSKPTDSLSFRVDRVRTTSATGREVVTPLVYAAHSLPSWKPYVKTDHGTIGNQDAFYCVAPRS